MAMAGHGEGDHEADGEMITAGCPAPPEPVLTLDFGSRYTDESETRSGVNESAALEMENALAPLDELISMIASDAEGLYDADADKRAVANCIFAQTAIWARANALRNLDSQTSKLTIGSRYAGLALVMLQAEAHTDSYNDVTTVRRWLTDLLYDQMDFWEQGPDGAKTGNLRAWAALAGASVALLTNDQIIKGWSAWSTRYVLCTANLDGSLPQEMSRGPLALHYQLHAIAPLVVSTVLLERQGIGLRRVCDNALDRVVRFALDDLDDGEMTRSITGEVQSFHVDGPNPEIDGFRMAWLEAYLQLHRSRELDDLAESYRPLSYSKLGGNQTLFWQ
jgi:poly(beta-D-mannuronate) lyase